MDVVVDFSRREFSGEVGRRGEAKVSELSGCWRMPESDRMCRWRERWVLRGCSGGERGRRGKCISVF